MYYFFFKGFFIIDRDGKHFGAILNFLRDGSISLPDIGQTPNVLHTLGPLGAQLVDARMQRAWRELQELLAEVHLFVARRESCG